MEAFVDKHFLMYQSNSCGGWNMELHKTSPNTHVNTPPPQLAMYTQFVHTRHELHFHRNCCCLGNVARLEGFEIDSHVKRPRHVLVKATPRPIWN